MKEQKSSKTSESDMRTQGGRAAASEYERHEKNV